GAAERGGPPGLVRGARGGGARGMRSPIRIGLFVLVLLGPSAVRAADLSLAEYRAQLAGIAADLAHGDQAAAREAAGQLLAARIAWGAESLAPDRSVLGPLARGARGTELRRAAVRLALLLARLPAAPA